MEIKNKRSDKDNRDSQNGRGNRGSHDERDNRDSRGGRENRDGWDSRDNNETAIVYGKNAVTELLRQGEGVDTVYLAEGLSPAVANYYTALAKEAGAAVKRVHAMKLRSMCGTDNNQGVAAYASAVEYATLDELLAVAAARGEDPLILLADGVEDPHNLGAMIRTALLAGAQGIVIPKRGGAQVTPIVAKTSAGASMVLPIARVANIGEAVRRLKEKNVFVYAADMEGPAMYKQNLTGPLALVLGSEGKGVSPLVKKLCDGLVSLPMSQHRAGVDSLNVSVATGVLMYEVVRQRGGF
ncbi:MAG: 23S rRNA (guanosine(2251)-2'-O)-methyltransferase RlmB [Pygmaiobacter sp.]|nr:23S rRNA (guanosine(2251)-2'-O)-methyltransferase RlmB [Pygmaiobacter sp.]